MLKCSLASYFKCNSALYVFEGLFISSFVIYSLSFYVFRSIIRYWGYRSQRIHVLKDSLVLGQADVWQSILNHLC